MSSLYIIDSDDEVSLDDYDASFDIERLEHETRYCSDTSDNHIFVPKLELTFHEVAHCADTYDDYDSSSEVEILLSACKYHEETSSDEECTSDDETYSINRVRHISKIISPMESHLMECRQFVSDTNNPKIVMGMINYLYRELEPLPYNVAPISCTRLELESEMRCTSDEEYRKFMANLASSRMIWLIENHDTKNRIFSESNITMLMYENYVGKYVCVSEGRSTAVWFFNKFRWIEISHAEIWQEISTSFIEFVRSFCVSKMKKLDDWEKFCNDIVKYLSSVSSRERIQKDLLYRLTNNSFQSKLNSNSHLIGMENGVYDLEKRQLRQALPMDYISMSTGINYLEQDKILRKELKEIIRNIFPNRKVRKFFMQSCASLLEGRNKDKFVYVWWGKGNNGKSMIEKLLACTFGNYSTVAATSLVTGKRSNADAANPQLSALEGKLAVFLQEPNPNETIKIGMVKELSGNDAITARALFKGNRTFIPKFKLIIVCNNAIEIPNIDIAFTNRLIVIPFQSTFWTKEDYRKRKKKGKLTDYDYPMDTSIGRNIGKYAETFFRMLVKEYESMDEIHVPKIIRKTTREYIEANNFSLLFIQTQTIDDDDGETSIKVLHSEMKRWMNDHYTGKKVPNIEMFREEIINQGYEIGKGIVYGLVVDYE